MLVESAWHYKPGSSHIHKHKQQNDGSFPCGSILAFPSQHPKGKTQMYMQLENSPIFLSCSGNNI